MKNKITAIIPVYNEQRTIKAIIENVTAIPIFSECIVVNDGSTDGTGLIIEKIKQRLNFRYIKLESNKGKGYALATACKFASGKLLVFIDADLEDFMLGHAFRLVRPILNNKAEIVIGHASKNLIGKNLNPFKMLSGQRALKKRDVEPILGKMMDSGYGVETLMNLHYKKEKLRMKVVDLPKLKHHIKFKKLKPWEAVKEFAKEAYEIFVTLFNSQNVYKHSRQVQ